MTQGVNFICRLIRSLLSYVNTFLFSPWKSPLIGKMSQFVLQIPVAFFKYSSLRMFPTMKCCGLIWTTIRVSGDEEIRWSRRFNSTCNDRGLEDNESVSTNPDSTPAKEDDNKASLMAMPLVSSQPASMYDSIVPFESRVKIVTRSSIAFPLTFFDNLLIYFTNIDTSFRFGTVQLGAERGRRHRHRVLCCLLLLVRPWLIFLGSWLI